MLEVERVNSQSFRQQFRTLHLSFVKNSRCRIDARASQPCSSSVALVDTASQERPYKMYDVAHRTMQTSALTRSGVVD